MGEEPSRERGSEAEREKEPASQPWDEVRDTAGQSNVQGLLGHYKDLLFYFELR